MSYAHDIAAVLIGRGAVVVRASNNAFPDGKARKDPARSSAWCERNRLTMEALSRSTDERFCLVVGSVKHGNLGMSGCLDIETDSPEAEGRLVEILGDAADQAPTMVTPSGSIHRLVAYVPPPTGFVFRLGRSALGPGIDVMWQNLAVDGDRRIWRGLNRPYPVVTEPLWKPAHKPIARTHKERLGELSPDEMDLPAPAWVPPAMRRIIDESPRSIGKHLRTFQLVRIGWEAGMSRNAIWRVVANDPTCRAWVADERNYGLLAEDVDRILRDVKWDRAENRYRAWVERGREAGAVSAVDTYSHFGRRTRDVDKAVSRAVDEGWLCCTTVRKANGGRPGSWWVFYDPATHRCALGHPAGPFRRIRPGL